MKNSCFTVQATRLPHRNNLIAAGIFALIFSFQYAPAHAEASTLSKDDMACLQCHDKSGMEKSLGNGEILSLQISAKAYAESMHNGTSCADCHTEIDVKTHGKVKTTINSKREFSHSMRESCRDCHKKKFSEYDDSVHAALIKEGSKKAPMCANCHNPHTVRSWKIVEPISATPCAKCHEDIFKAYSGDVHGLERVSKGKGAPLCADCHKAHNVKAASMGDGIKDACLSCHKDVVKGHQDWLPKAERHFEAISCPVCHAPTAQRRVNLRLYDGMGATKHQMSEKSGVPKFEKRTQVADAKDAGLDERALWSLLREFNQDGNEGNTILRGRLEVKSGVEAHQLSEKSRAIKDCKVCHQAGAEPFQSVTLTIAGPDGRPLRHGVQKEVLNSLLSVESIRGFYVIGGTRIKLLDTLLIMV
ncbi:MAG: cytochrome c3 family protein, partial [Pseudomonadota bacterium]